MTVVRRVLAPLLTVAFAPMVVAACAGGPSVSIAQYRTRAGAVCRDLQHRTDELPQLTASASTRFVRAGRHSLALQRAALGRIEALDPPHAQAPTIRRWLHGVRAALDAGAASLQAQSDGDLAAARAANARGTAAIARADALARSLGVDTCATPTTG